MANGLIGKVTAGGGTHLIASTAYGTCSTAAATVEKIATIQDSHEFTLYNGITIHIWMQYHNTSTNPTLDVNSTGAKPIYRYGTTVPGTSAASSWNAGAVVSFTYNTNNATDGAWVMNDWANNNDNTLLRTYKAYATNVELPLIGGSTGSTSPAAPTGETSYAALYGQIPKTTANRATYNLSTGKITVPGGVVADITGNVSGTAANVTGTVAIANGGTGATSAADARTNLGLGTLATKSSIANHSYTPAGTITLSNENTTTTVSAAASGTTTYTPAGSVSQPTFSGNSLTSTGNFTPAGSVSVSTNTTTNKTTTVSAAASGTTTYTPGGTNSAPAFTGTATTIVVNGGTGTATYTPAGTIEVDGATSTATVVKTTVFYDVVTSATVASEILTISTGAAGTSTQQTGVRIADPAYKFTGTGTRLTASYTPAGSVAAPTFTGTPVRLVTGNIAVPNTYTATFTGTQGSVSVTGTPAGTVSKPTFSGTAVRLVTGNISRPTSATFTGTAATLSHTVS